MSDEILADHFNYGNESANEINLFVIYGSMIT